jgi:hypothetical protein
MMFESLSTEKKGEDDKAKSRRGTWFQNELRRNKPKSVVVTTSIYKE